MKKSRMKFPVQEGKNSAKMPQLVAPVNALDEETAKVLFENQKVVVEHLIEFSKQVISIKKDMKKEAGELIDAEIKSRFTLMEFCLREIRLFCEILVEKKIATQDEISKKRDKIRKENG